MSKQHKALKLALEALERHAELGLLAGATIIAIREALADSALDRMADNARELGLDYGPAQQIIKHAPCQGMNCGITRTDQEHSPECQAEHAAAIARAEGTCKAKGQK